MAVSFVATGVASGGTTTATPSVPVGHAVADLLLLLAGNKPTNTPAVSGATYALVGTADIGNGVANGLNVGDARASIWSRVVTSTAEAAPTATVTSGSPTRVQMYCFRSAGGFALKGGGGGDTTSGTDVSITATGFVAGDFKAGDWIVAAVMIPGNDVSITSYGAGIPGCVLGTPQASSDGGNVGNRGRLVHLRGQVTSGSSIGQPTITLTLSGPQTATAYMTRIREVSYLTTTATLGLDVGLAATGVAVLTTTAALPVTAGLTATALKAGTLATTAALPVAVGLTAVSRPVYKTAVTLPLTAGLTALIRLPPPPGVATEIKHQLRTLSGAPAVRVHVRARLLAPAYQTDDTELIPPAETYTDAIGMFRFYLPPSSTLTPAGVYEITWAGAKRRITVPDTGPVWLTDAPEA